MDRKQQVLQKLRETDSYLSGQELSEALGISRTAVWKIVGKLKQEGYPIEAVTNKGYRLLSVEGKDLLNQEELERAMHTAWVGKPLIYREETGSTNTDLFKLSEKGARQGTIEVTSKQTAGKGRRGRTWISPPDVNVYMSILLTPAIRPDTAPMLTLVMAMAVYEACEELYGDAETEANGGADLKSAQNTAGEPAHEEAREPDHALRFGIKWPNDIVVSADGGSFKKICGILTEMRLEEMEIRDIVIGIGLNVNQTEFPEEIQETAGSLRLALGKTVNRAQLTAAVWKHFEEDYEVFLKAQSLEPLRERYEKGLVNRRRKVRVLDPASPFEGTAIGINSQGELIVRMDDGSPDRAIGTGEVSVRGVMGYV
jgi:BirA family biotin operon repressor/biotin-[acetyl-CoA-carboxylase] ligase